MTANGAEHRAPGLLQVPCSHVGKPVEVAFVLMPSFTMLAFTSALEPLRIANQITGQRLFRWTVLSETGQPVTCSNGLRLAPDRALGSDMMSGHVFICGGLDPETGATARLADWIRAQWRHGCNVGAICTGAYALAKAGVLAGRQFTLHWEHIAAFRELHPKLYPDRSVYCVDERITTCAGGIAAAEVALRLVESHYGPELAQTVMDMCLLVRRRTGDDQQRGSLAARIGTRNASLVRAVQYIEDRAEDDFDLDACAAEIDVSRRQIQRLFKQHVGVSPKQYLNSVRLQRGRALLCETDMSVLEVAVACGYKSGSHFSKSFRIRYGVTPHRFTNFRAAEHLADSATLRLIGGTL